MVWQLSFTQVNILWKVCSVAINGFCTARGAAIYVYVLPVLKSPLIRQDSFTNVLFL